MQSFETQPRVETVREKMVKLTKTLHIVLSLGRHFLAIRVLGGRISVSSPTAEQKLVGFPFTMSVEGYRSLENCDCCRALTPGRRKRRSPTAWAVGRVEAVFGSLASSAKAAEPK